MIARRSRAASRAGGAASRRLAGLTDPPAKILGFPPGSKAFARTVPRGCRLGSGVLLGSGYEFDLRVMPAKPQKKFLTSARVAGATRVAHGGRSLSVHPENPRLLVNFVGNRVRTIAPPWVLQISGV